MLPKLKLLLGYYTVRLGEPLPKADDSLVGIVLKHYRIVKGDLRERESFVSCGTSEDSISLWNGLIGLS